MYFYMHFWLFKNVTNEPSLAVFGVAQEELENSKHNALHFVE